MALQYPAVVPTGYAGTYIDFLQTKVDRSGAVRLITGQTSIPASTTTATLIGLFPFQPGFKLCYGSWFQCAAAGTSVTLTLGYYFENSALTSNTAAYLAATSVSSATVLTPNVAAGAIVDTNPTNTTTGGEGWVVCQVGGATTATTATLITYNALIAYDLSGVTN